MDDETLKALKKSINHWEQVLIKDDLDDIHMGPDQCALCVLFNGFVIEEYSCLGCLVYNYTHKKYCVNSPYRDASGALNQWKFSKDKKHKKNWQEKANEELNFLISLLPNKG